MINFNKLSELCIVDSLIVFDKIESTGNITTQHRQSIFLKVYDLSLKRKTFKQAIEYMLRFL